VLDGGEVKAVALLIVIATPAFADVAVPQAKTWRDGCAARLDEAAKAAGLPTGAQSRLLPLLHEDGTPNPVQYVEYATTHFRAVAGDESEPRPDQAWRGREVLFRRYHNRFAKIEGVGLVKPFKAALDECLKMGDLK
jgi:hypothetical protein